MKRVLVRIVVLLAIAAAVFFFWRKRVDGKGELVLSGSIEARLVEVGSLVGGRVAEVRIEEGAEVAAGAVLVVLESDLVDPRYFGKANIENRGRARRGRAQERGTGAGAHRLGGGQDRPRSRRAALSRRGRRPRRVRPRPGAGGDQPQELGRGRPRLAP